jgi:hypothetical protein
MPGMTEDELRKLTVRRAYERIMELRANPPKVRRLLTKQYVAELERKAKAWREKMLCRP